MSETVKIDFAKFKPLPVGKSDWATFSQTNYTVDKTLLIKDLIDDDTGVALFTRPRRFGKTTALQMIKTFFEKTPKDTSFLFADKKIWAAGGKYRQEQGKYPVIYLTFKDVTGTTFETAFNLMRRQIVSAVGDHQDVVSALPVAEERDALERILAGKADLNDCGSALGLLAKAVHLANPNGVKPIILIDEYDQPVNNASTGGYLKEMTSFMRSFLSGAMKDNNHVKMGIMTGVLRVAKEGILSGLNNLKVWTVFSWRYSEYFGFTEDEVAAMAAFYRVPEKMAEIKSWYDGYNFGGVEIYNPWSVLNYFDNYCDAKAYWLDTSSNDIITDIVRDLPHDTAETLEKLLSEGSRATVKMTQELGPYAKIREQKDTLYALLVSTGYLKCNSPITNGYCQVTIPNHEIEQVFVDDIVSKLSNTMPIGPDDIGIALVEGNPLEFRDAIRRFLEESVSYFDSASEGFFHGLMLGFLAILRDRYRVLSNRESGDGRYDIALFPLIPNFPGVIIEIKAAKAENDDLKALAQAAREQIDARRYVSEMSAQGITDVMKLGLAFYQKNVAVVQ